MLDTTKLLCISLVLLAGCSYHPGAPRVDRPWANREREVISAGIPKDAEWKDVDVLVGAETISLEDLDGRKFGDERLVVRLGPGLWKLVAPVTIEGGHLEVIGAGPEKTRLVLDTEDELGLKVVGGKLDLRSLTIASYSSGGVIAERSKVRAIDVDFAGSSYGLHLVASTSVVSSSVFAGCSVGVNLDGGTARVQGCAFNNCWEGLGGRGTIQAKACTFTALRGKAIAASLSRNSSLDSCLFAGVADLGARGGAPLRASLVPQDDLGGRAANGQNRAINYLEQFPDSLPNGFPDAMDIAGVTMALERVRARGAADSPERVKDALLAEARRYSKLARDMKRSDKPLARAAAALARDFVALVDDPEAKDEIRDLAEIAR